MHFSGSILRLWVVLSLSSGSFFRPRPRRGPSGAVFGSLSIRTEGRAALGNKQDLVEDFFATTTRGGFTFGRESLVGTSVAPASVGTVDDVGMPHESHSGERTSGGGPSVTEDGALPS